MIKIGILGAGTVGSGVVAVLRENAAEIAQRTGRKIEIKTVFVRDIQKPRPIFAGITLTNRIEDILADEEISIVVEVMGGIEPAKDYMKKALLAGKSVVTANKDVVARYGKELFETAEQCSVDFLFEASVGGGIPIIAPLKNSLNANRITKIMGIVNGTTNYMLTEMAAHGSDYDTVLKEAQTKGYAEADPTADVEGFDAARKVAILSSIAFNTRISLDDVSTEGISKITPDDIQYAKELGYVVKLLAIGKDYGDLGINVRVHPIFLPAEHPLASVNGVFNAIFVRGNAIGEAMFYGPGAGSLPTASAVVSDIIEAARNHIHDIRGKLRCTCYEQRPICSIDDTSSSYYIRLLVDDEPGVLGAIATAFGKEEVSLLSVIQTARVMEHHAEIVAITHRVEHRKMMQAISVLKSLPVVDEIRSMIRVESRQEK